VPAWRGNRVSLRLRSIDCRSTRWSATIYIPPETLLLAAARARDNVTVNGLGLLLNQARQPSTRGSA
jgi:hypothetical protein